MVYLKRRGDSALALDLEYDNNPKKIIYKINAIIIGDQTVNHEIEASPVNFNTNRATKITSKIPIGIIPIINWCAY